MGSSDTIRVSLDLFEGPLDLLLHLIQHQQIDISSISISIITSQYLEALDLMKEMDLDIAGEYLVMASTLIFMKSQYLLPPSGVPVGDEDVEDPRENLIQRLKEYRLFREAGHHLAERHEFQANFFMHPVPDELKEQYTDWIIDASVLDLLRALKDVVSRMGHEASHLIQPNSVSIREKMSFLVVCLTNNGPCLLNALFTECRTRQDVIALFLAMLELVRLNIIQFRQKKIFGDILVSLLPSISKIGPDNG